MDTTGLILSIAAVLGGLATIVGALFAVYKVARRIDDAIGVDSKGRTISERLDRVEHQLWENGGSSLADRVNKIERASEHTSTEVTMIKDFIMSGSLVPQVSIEAVDPIVKTNRRRAPKKQAS
jgi:hypothetical protein